MGIFRKWTNRQEAQERLPKIVPGKCLGEHCVYFSGVECQSYDDLLNTDGTSGGKDLSQLREEASYAMYGQICTGGAKETLVTIRAEVLKPDADIMMIVGRAGRYGDLPLFIEDHSPKSTEVIAAN